MKKPLTLWLLLLLMASSMQSMAQYSHTIYIPSAAYPAVTTAVGLDITEALNQASTDINTWRGDTHVIIHTGSYWVGTELSNSVESERNLMYKWINGYEYKYSPPIVNIAKCTNVLIEGETSNVTLKYNSGMYYGRFNPDGTPNVSATPLETSEVAEMGAVFNLIDCNTTANPNSFGNIVVKSLTLDGNIDGLVVGGETSHGEGIQRGADGIFIHGSRNVTIQGVTAKNFGHDGIQVLNVTTDQWSPNQSIELLDCVFDTNARQGLSWTGGKGLHAANCKFNNTGRGRFSTAPSAGVDIEPDDNTASGSLAIQGRFEDCEFVNNLHFGLISWCNIASTTTVPGHVRDVIFDRCRFVSKDARTIEVIRPEFSFYNCQSYGSIILTYPSNTTQDATKYINCYFSDKLLNPDNTWTVCSDGYSPFWTDNQSTKGMIFDRCQFNTYIQRVKIWNGLRYGRGDDCSGSAYGNGSGYVPVAARTTFTACNFLSAHTSNDLAVEMAGVTWRGNSVINRAPGLPGAIFSMQDVLITKESGSLPVQLGGNGIYYRAACPGAFVGVDDVDDTRVELQPGTTFDTGSAGQFGVMKNAVFVVKSGATLLINQSSQVYVHGKIIVEKGGTLSVQAYANITLDADAKIIVEDSATFLFSNNNAVINAGASSTNVCPGSELAISQQAIIPVPPLNFQCMAVCVTGGNNSTRVLSGPCAQNSALAIQNNAEQSLQSSAIIAYPLPFDNEITVELPDGAQMVRVVDQVGRLRSAQRVKEGTHQLQLGHELASGLYFLQIVSNSGIQTTRITKE